MGRVADGWREYRDRSHVQQLKGIDCERYPEIAELLCGKAGASGTAWDRPPLSLLLYLDGEGAKFCFSTSGFPMQLWGSCGPLRDGLDAIEEALCRGNCDWRKKRDDKQGFTNHR